MEVEKSWKDIYLGTQANAEAFDSAALSSAYILHTSAYILLSRPAVQNHSGFPIGTTTP